MKANNTEKKIGIITFFRDNYGSILQCYATCKILKKNGFIPFVLEKKENRIKNVLRFALRCIKHPCDIQTFLYMRKMQSSSVTKLPNASIDCMNDFIERELPVLSLNSGQIKKIGYDKDFIAFLSGSDQIWGGHAYIIDSTRFLRFAPQNKRIAWAPSFGNADIARYNVKEYKKYISQYNSLSVRESSAVSMVRKLTGINPTVLTDPVFLLSREEWGAISVYASTDKYAMCYFLDSISYETIEQINNYCKSNNVKLIVFGPSDYQRFKVHTEKLNGGPDLFVSLIAHAQCVFTDSFHATSFSIIMKTPFFVYKRNYTHGIDQSSRIQTLLEKMHMQQCFEPRNVLKFEGDFSYSDMIILNDQQVMTKYLLESINLHNLGE